MTDAEWEAAFAALPAQLDELESYRGRLGESAATLLAAFQKSDAVGQRLGRMAVYAFLRKDEDTTNATYQALADRAQQLLVRANAAESYMRPELLALPDGTLERFQAEEPGLRLYAHVFDDLLRGKPHVLTPAEETLLAEVGELAAAPGTIYEMLSDADMKFGTVTDEEGTEVELTEGR
jgi:oligoendopeptidase F